MLATYKQVKRVWDDFKVQKLGEHHDLCMQSDTLKLADAFESSRSKCIEMDKLDPSSFLSTPGLAWQKYLKKTEVELEVLNDVYMQLKVVKNIRGRMCHAIHRYAKANNKYIKDYDPNKESSYLM